MASDKSPPDSPQGPGGVIHARAMPAEPDIKRAVSFIDGQNLYRHAKDAFGHHHPNYDPRKLTDAVCADCGWVSHGVPLLHRRPERRQGADVARLLDAPPDRHAAGRHHCHLF